MRKIGHKLATGPATLAAAVVSLAVIAGPAHAQADFDGRWTTNQGDLSLHQDGSDVYGEYTTYRGHLEGHAEEDGRLSGIWWQTSASQRCIDERHGTYFWGRFRFRQNDDGDAFRGRWSYCDRDPGDEGGGDWTGRRTYHRNRHRDLDHP